MPNKATYSDFAIMEINPPPTYFKIAILTTILIDLVFPNPEITQTPIRYFGIIPVLFGLLFMLWAHQIFQNQKTAIRPDGKPSKLITVGHTKLVAIQCTWDLFLFH